MQLSPQECVPHSHEANLQESILLWLGPWLSLWRIWRQLWWSYSSRPQIDLPFLRQPNTLLGLSLVLKWTSWPCLLPVMKIRIFGLTQVTQRFDTQKNRSSLRLKTVNGTSLILHWRMYFCFNWQFPLKNLTWIDAYLFPFQNLWLEYLHVKAYLLQRLRASVTWIENCEALKSQDCKD